MTVCTKVIPPLTIWYPNYKNSSLNLDFYSYHFLIILKDYFKEKKESVEFFVVKYLCSNTNLNKSRIPLSLDVTSAFLI